MRTFLFVSFTSCVCLIASMAVIFEARRAGIYVEIKIVNTEIAMDTRIENHETVNVNSPSKPIPSSNGKYEGVKLDSQMLRVYVWQALQQLMDVIIS